MHISSFRKFVQIRKFSFCFSSSLWNEQSNELDSKLPPLDYVPQNPKYVRDPSNNAVPKRVQNRRSLLPKHPKRKNTLPYEDENFPNPKAPFAYVDFRRLETPSQIMNALYSARNFIQIRQIVAALTRFRALGITADKRMISEVIEMAKETIGSCRVEDAVGLFLSLSRLRKIDDPQFLNNLARLTIDRHFIKDMTIRELATMIHSCGFLLRCFKKKGIHPQQEIDTQARPSGYEPHLEYSCGLNDVEELLEGAIEEFSIFREFDDEFELRLPSVLTSLEHFGRKDWRLDQLIKRLAHSMTNIKNISEDRISAIVYAFANCRIDDRGLLEKLSMEIVKPERLSAFQTQQLLGVMNAFEKLGFESYGIYYALFLELTQKIRLLEMTIENFERMLSVLVSKKMNDDSELVSKIFMELVSPQRVTKIRSHEVKELLVLSADLPECPLIDATELIKKVGEVPTLSEMPHDKFVSLIIGCSRFRINKSSLTDILVNKAKQKPCLDRLESHGLISILYAFLKMGKNSLEELNPLIKRCLTPKMIGEIQGQYCYMLIEILGKLKVDPHSHLQLLFQRIQDSRDIYSVHQTISCLSHLSWIPNINRENVEPFIDEFYERSGRLTIKPSDAGRLIRALGDLRIYHVGIMEQLKRCIHYQHGALSNQDITDCLLGFAWLNFRDTASIGLLLTQAKHVLGLETFNSSNLVVMLCCLVSMQISTEHYKDIVSEAVTWIRLNSLTVHELVALLLCLAQLEQKISFKTTDSVVHICEFLDSHQDLFKIQKKQLQEIRLCLIQWNVYDKLLAKINALADEHNSASLESEQKREDFLPLIAMDCKHMTKSWAERLLDGR